MIVSIFFHKDGIDARNLCSVLIEAHPTFAMNKAYAILRDIMPTDRPWFISEIHYFPEKVDTKSRLEVRAAVK